MSTLSRRVLIGLINKRKDPIEHKSEDQNLSVYHLDFQAVARKES